jgi:hypothetical protein
MRAMATKDAAFPKFNASYPIWLGLAAGGDAMIIGCDSSGAWLARRGEKKPAQVPALTGRGCYAIAPDRREGAYVSGASTSSDGKKVPPSLVLFDASTGEQRHRIEGIHDDPSTIAWGSAGHIAIQFYPDLLAIFEVEALRAGKNKPLRAMERADMRDERALRLAFSHDGESVLYVVSRQVLHVGIDGSSKSIKLPDELWRSDFVEVAPTGDLAGPTGVFTSNGKLKWAEKADGESLYCDRVAFSPDGSKLVCIGDATKHYKKPQPGMAESGFVAVHDADTGKRLAWIPRTSKKEARAVAVDDNVIAIGPNAKAVEVYAWEQLGVSPNG